MPCEQEKKIKIELSPSQKKIETPKCKISSEREKEINLFKSVLLSDYKEEEIDDEFDQHIHDICFQIVQGRWLKKEIFAKKKKKIVEEKDVIVNMNEIIIDQLVD